VANTPKALVSLLLKLWIAVCVAGAGGILALGLMPGLAILPSAAGVPTTPYCSLWQAVRDSQIKINQADEAKLIHAQSRLLREEDGLKLWSTPDGEFWVPASNDNILGMLLAQQRRKIYGDAANGGVRPGDIVLDCGAHVGTFVRAALKAGAAKVVAIEPSPEAIACLRRNFAKETAEGRVIVYPKGVWDEEKKLVFFANGSGAAGDSFVAEGVNAVPIADIPVNTIDNIARELGLPRVDMIKADVKGAAARAMKGAASTLRRFHPRVAISTEEDDDPAEVHAQLMKLAPDYRFRPGPCLFNGDAILTDVIFFE
jgi:FkbM family methyltransferase